MELEIGKPELVQRVSAYIKASHFHDADDLHKNQILAIEGIAIC
ncbi:MAG TPA: hypothetical protein VG273_26260 [Bryobacteraceae bacterium]|jgi:hypothetical protein|nr:hypothetical protein [Bryobacteraceae bacterium]